MPWPISAKCNNLKKTITDENLPVPILRRAASCGDARSGLRSCPEKPEEPEKQHAPAVLEHSERNVVRAGRQLRQVRGVGLVFS